MLKSLGIGIVALLLAMPLIAEDVGPITSGNVPSQLGAPAEEPTPRIPVQVPSGSIHGRTIHRTIVISLPYMTVDEKTGKPTTKYRTVSRVVAEKVPADPAEIESLRRRLKELHERRIDLLTPEELATEVSQGAAEAKEREAWTKLQEARAQLLKVSAEFPDTQAARIAVSAQNAIPETERPTNPEPTSAPFNPVPRNPLPTY